MKNFLNEYHDQISQYGSFEPMMPWFDAAIHAFNIQLKTDEDIITITDEASDNGTQLTTIKYKKDRTTVQRATATSSSESIAAIAGQIKMIWALTGKMPNLIMILTPDGKTILSLAYNISR
jgi:hypothetical protein